MAGERQVAIVTGAASGIGRAMSLGLLEAGIDVAAVDREPAWLDELKTAASGRRLNGTLQTIRADLTDPTSFDAIVSTVLGESGRLDILSTTRALGRTRSAPIAAATRSDFGRSRRNNGAALSRSMRRRP